MATSRNTSQMMNEDCTYSLVGGGLAPAKVEASGLFGAFEDTKARDSPKRRQPLNPKRPQKDSVRASSASNHRLGAHPMRILSRPLRLRTQLRLRSLPYLPSQALLRRHRNHPRTASQRPSLRKPVSLRLLPSYTLNRPPRYGHRNQVSPRRIPSTI